MSGSLINGSQTVTITLAGRDYNLRRAKVSLFHEAEAEILRRRPDPLKRVAEIAVSLPKEQAEMVWRLAMEKAASPAAVTTEDLTAWISTIEGMTWFIWWMIQGCPDAPTQEQLRAIVSEMEIPELEDLGARIQIASGMPDLKN